MNSFLKLFQAVVPEADGLAKAGDCRFYELFEQRFPCSTWRLASHVDDFELPLCERYDEMLDLFEDKVYSYIWVK